MRGAFYSTSTWGAVTLLLALTGIAHERILGPWPFVIPLVSTALLGAACNVMEIPLFPDEIRSRIKPGIRERLWRSKVGGWLARQLGAPDRSQLNTATTSERLRRHSVWLHRSSLLRFPRRIASSLRSCLRWWRQLEARAAGARADMEVLAALAPSGSVDAELLVARRESAAQQLSQSVAALEGIRLDLLRLHASASDLAPLRH